MDTILSQQPNLHFLFFTLQYLNRTKHAIEQRTFNIADMYVCMFITYVYRVEDKISFNFSALKKILLRFFISN